MKTTLFILLVAGVPAFSQLTANQRIGAFAGYGGGVVIERPEPLPPGIVRLKGMAENVWSNQLILRLDAEAKPESASVLITNYPNLNTIATDQPIIAHGQKIGITQDAWGARRELYQYIDLKQYQANLNARAAAEARAKAAEKAVADQQRAIAAHAVALKANQTAAAKGEPYGLLRMGERYRDGEGVPKDLTQARSYFQRAAAAGSTTAQAALDTLPTP